MASWLPKRNAISRRTLLRGMLGGSAVAVGLPALEIFLNDHGTAYADCGVMPTVFGVFYFGNGVLPEKWNPPESSSGGPYELTPLLGGLRMNEGGDVWDVTRDVSVITGLRVQTSNTSPHGSGPAGLFSGADLVSDTFVGPSLDQVIADGLAEEGARRFHSLEIGVQRSTSSWSMTGPNQVNPPDCDPFSFYQRVFGGDYRRPGAIDPETAHRIALRRSVLDAVGEQARSLQSRVGAADRARLDQHFTGIRDLEGQLARLASAPPAQACQTEDVPTGIATEYPDLDGRPQMRAIHRALIDTMAMALACDQTRVFFEMFSQPVNNTLFLDAPSGHHQLTHDEPGDQPQVERIVHFILGELGYLVNRLASITEGSQRLLDRCAILGTTDCSYGRTHSLDDYPMLIAGNACGRLHSGIHVHSTGNASSVPLTLLDAVGVARTEYGRGAARTTLRLSELMR